MWSKLVRGCICWCVLINVINSSGIILDYVCNTRIYLFPLVAACQFFSSFMPFLLPFDQVVKFLVERNNSNALHGQITIGTLIFQVTYKLFLSRWYTYQYLTYIELENLILSVISIQTCTLNCFRTVLLAYYLPWSPFWGVTVAFCREWFLWESCKFVHGQFSLNICPF